MSDTTRYLVDVDYRLSGVEKALAQTKAAGAATDKLAKGLEWVKRAAIAAGGAFVFGKIGSALVGANRELESMQIGMATVLSMSLDKPFKDAEPIAARLVEHYRQIAKISPGTTKDFLEFHNLASGAVLGRGGSLGDLKKITEGGVIAGKAFGFRGDVAGRDVQQALTGNVSMQTPMIKMLLGSEAKIAEFNKMSGKQRVAALVQAFQSPALKDAAKKYGESFEGQLSTLKDNSDNLFRTIGRPLFVQLNKWMASINAWAERNAGRIESFATNVGNALATGARWLIKGVTYLVDNWKTIALMGGIFASLGVVKGIATGGGLAGTFANLVKSGNLAAVALGALAIGLPIAFQKLDKVFGDVRGWALDKIGPEARKAYGAQASAAMGASVGGSGAGALLGAFGEAMAKRKAMEDDALAKKAEKPPRQPVNVTIKRVEVVADDADRFIQDVISRVGQEITSPSQWRGMPLVGV